jgi:hypothetical protein
VREPKVESFGIVAVFKDLYGICCNRNELDEYCGNVNKADAIFRSRVVTSRWPGGAAATGSKRPKSGHSDLGWQMDKADSQPELRSPVFQWPEFFRFYQSPRRPLELETSSVQT